MTRYLRRSGPNPSLRPFHSILIVMIMMLSCPRTGAISSPPINFSSIVGRCQKGVNLGKIKKKINWSQCKKSCARQKECTAFEHKYFSKKNKKNRCQLYRRCDVLEYKIGIEKCPKKRRCAYKKIYIPSDTGKSPYDVQYCVAKNVGEPCPLRPVPHLRYMKHPTELSCDEAEGQGGSVSWVDLILPQGGSEALYIQVKTNVPKQTLKRGFFVRPTRLTREWGKATIISDTSASFYLAGTGQFSVEFASDSLWRDYDEVTTYEALMVFVNPELNIPNGISFVSPNTKEVAIDLGPDEEYIFSAGIKYDWGRDHVFKVHSNTEIYFEHGAHVRARFVQTEKKVKNVLISGFGTIDSHYDLEDDLVGISDDATRQNIGIYGKDITVFGVTMTNTNPTCGAFGYCLNLNANWSPIVSTSTPEEDIFDAYQLQLKDPPFKYYPAHCQLNNMDDTPNTDFTNCPKSHSDGGQTVLYVKCMTWQLGQDGINAGVYGTVKNSFIRATDDSIKPWDNFGVYKDITIWQLALGWPINFGWWNWNQPDVGTIVDTIYVIHNHNWISSGDWPQTKSGQCVVGGVYGSGAPKSGYKLSNIFVETASSCAVGLEISKNAYSRHPTIDGCVGSISDVKIEGMFFDEEFYQRSTGSKYSNFLSGEKKPNNKCKGNLSGKIDGMFLSGLVAGRPLSKSDFIINEATVPGLKFADGILTDPHPPALDYMKYAKKNAYVGNGGSTLDIDEDGVSVQSYLQCIYRCHSDWSCECVVFQPSNSMCWKRGGCRVEMFEEDTSYEVYVRQWANANEFVVK